MTQDSAESGEKTGKKAQMKLELDGDDFRSMIREKFTEASGPSDCNVATPPVTPFDDVWNDGVDEVKSYSHVPDDALIQRIVLDCPGEYVKVWYTTEDMQEDEVHAE